MTVQFRNLSVTPQAPVSAWGVEGILTAVERGDITDWRKVIRAARVDREVAADFAQALQLAEGRGGAPFCRLMLCEITSKPAAG